MEELQSKEKASSSKRKKQKLDDFDEADDNSNLQPCKEEMESDDYKSEDGDSEEENEMEELVKNEANEEVKEELGDDNIEANDPNIKMEKEEDDDDGENITNFEDGQEHGWHHDEDDDDTDDGDNSSQEVLVKPDFSDDIPAVRSRCVQPKVKNEGMSNKCSLCTECGESFVGVRSLADHVKVGHNTQQIVPSSHSGEEHRPTSAEAKEDMVTSSDLNELEETPFDTATPANCETCIDEGKPTKIYKNRSNLQIHFTDWHDFGTYLCDTCGESFKLRGQLRKHNSAKHSQKSQSKGGACPHCGKVVKHLSGHISEVHGPKKEYVCPVCARILNTLKQMRDHVRANHNNEGKVFICHICSKELGNELNLKQHLRRQHYQAPTPEDYVTCNECGKQFPTEYRLKAHRRAVHESDPTNCDICGGNYKNKYSLSKHMKNAHDGHLSRPKVGKGSYRMPNPAIVDESSQASFPFVSP